MVLARHNRAEASAAVGALPPMPEPRDTDADEPRLHPPATHEAALCELIHHTTRLNLHREPGEQLSGFIREAFALEALAIFDHDLDKTYLAGPWTVDPDNNLRNVHLFERSGCDVET